jgi:hypothetical protein
MNNKCAALVGAILFAASGAAASAASKWAGYVE